MQLFRFAAISFFTIVFLNCSCDNLEYLFTMLKCLYFFNRKLKG